MLHFSIDFVSIYEFAERYFVHECDCEYWKEYSDFLVKYKRPIKEFLIAMAGRAELAIEEEKTYNILKSKTIIDTPPF